MPAIVLVHAMLKNGDDALAVDTCMLVRLHQSGLSMDYVPQSTRGPVRWDMRLLAGCGKSIFNAGIVFQPVLRLLCCALV